MVIATNGQTGTVTEDQIDIAPDIESAPPRVQGIWDDREVFTLYRVSATFTDKIMGGIPQKPDAIEAWLRQRITKGDEEVKRMMKETLQGLEINTDGMTTIEQLKEAARIHATEQHANTFYRDEHGMYISGYQIKASIKENVNILYAGDRWGKTNKGPKGFVAERVFVDEDRIYLGRYKPDGMQLQVGHVNGPRGPRSILTYYDYVLQPEVTFTVFSLRDEVTQQQWKEIFLAAQRNGIGAVRSMGFGQFRVTGFEKLD